MGIKFWRAQIAGTTSRVSDCVGLTWGIDNLRFDTFLGDAAAVLGTTL